MAEKRPPEPLVSRNKESALFMAILPDLFTLGKTCYLANKICFSAKPKNLWSLKKLMISLLFKGLVITMSLHFCKSSVIFSAS